MNQKRAKQRGAATLLVSMVLLIAATLLALYVSNPVVGEQRMSANEMRSKQAFAAAQAAIDLAVEHMNSGGDFQTASLNDLNSRWSSANSSYRALFCKHSDIDFDDMPECADDAASGISPESCGTEAFSVDDTASWVVGCGWSDDSSARKRIVSFVTKSNPLPGAIGNPLTAGGSVTFGGNSTVVNYYNNLTVWSGLSLSNTGNNGKTVIRRPSSAAGQLNPDQVDAQVGGGNQVCNENLAPDLICTTSSGVFGPDVNQGDPSLKRLSPDQFFENFLGSTPNEYKSTMVEESVPGAEAGEIVEGGKVYWVDGDAVIGQDIGSAAEPVVLVVDGNLTLSGTTTIFGVVFVKGDLTTSGTPKVRGAVLATGAVNSAGTLNIIFDPDAIAGARRSGKYASVQGTWRDF